MTPGREHIVAQHRSALPGVEALTLLTDHAFPRHSHDGFGVGVMAAGAQRSWSGIGWVEAEAGDVITVSPGDLRLLWGKVDLSLMTAICAKQPLVVKRASPGNPRRLPSVRAADPA